MSRQNRAPYMAALLTVLAGLIVVASSQPRGPAPSPKGAIGDWSVADMIRNLQSKGLPLQAVSTLREGSIGDNAFLLTGAKTWEELNLLPKDSRAMPRWSGVVYCKRVNRPDMVPLALCGDCALEVGPFDFFGDPDLLARIRAALPDEPS
jgi:hypothetical protein